MKTHTHYITLTTDKRIDFVRLTHKVQQIVEDSKVQDGIVLVNPMHITASIYINDNEAGLIKDYQIWLEKLAPKDHDYNHHQTGEDNGFSHLWRTIMGREATVAITNGKLDLGPWEEIFYAEFDGMRPKRVLVKVLGV